MADTVAEIQDLKIDETPEQTKEAEIQAETTEKTADEKRSEEEAKIEERRRNMDPKHRELFDAIERGDASTVKHLVLEEKVSPNITDENYMSPLLQASYKGHYGIMEFLISRGADVNATSHTNFYTALMMSSIAGKRDCVKLLLDAGASVSTQNSIEKTASDMAGFVGQHEIATLIRNYLALDRLEPYYTPQGENPARIEESIARSLQEMVMATNYHPVKIAITIHDSPELKNVENLKKSASVLDDLCSKCVRGKFDFDEVLAMKLHFVSAIVHLCQEHLEKNEGDLTTFIKMLLKENEKGIKLGCEKIIRQTLIKFPYTDLPLLQYLVKALSPIVIGEEPTALGSIQTIFNGMQAMRNVDTWCSACGDRKAELRCSLCKTTRYCNRQCQKFHWFVHKKKCARAETK